MKFRLLLSDQLLTWSEIYGRYFLRSVAQASKTAFAAIAVIAIAAIAWFAHRTVQAVRQTELQMRRGPRPRPQALPVGEPPRTAPSDGLRAARKRRRSHDRPGEFPSGPRDTRGNLRDQSRAVAPPRGAVTIRDERNEFIAHRPHRYPICRRAHCEHDRELAYDRTSFFSHPGARP